MGWAGGGGVFDCVADGLTRARASDQIKRDVLGPLIDWLRAEDWDTAGETLLDYTKDKIIVELFAVRGITLEVDL